MEENTLVGPYRGLMPYREEDAAYFFGRERGIRLVTANLFAARLTVLYGVSGVGKTSVLRAGVAYHLRQRGDVAVAVCSAWSRDPVASLKKTVARHVNPLLNEQLSVPESAPLADFLTECSIRLGSRLMVILDQFEDYFRYRPRENGEGTFAVEFPRAVNRSDLHIGFLISIREDSLARLDHFKGRIPNLFDNYLRLERLDCEAARVAITKPIEQYNGQHAKAGREIHIEPALVEKILARVETGKISLDEAGRGAVARRSRLAQPRIETAYLQLIMTRLWKEAMESGVQVLRVGTLEDLGGAAEIVRTHLDQALSGLTIDEQDCAARVFRHLVTPSGAKRAHTISDLAGYAELPEAQLKTVLQKLTHPTIRVLRTVAPPPDQPGTVSYEVFCDILGPAINVWRTRFTLARERAESERKLTKVRASNTGLIRLLAVIALLVVGVIYGYWNAVRLRRQAQNNEQRAVSAKVTSDILREEAVSAKATSEALRVQEMCAQQTAEARRLEAVSARETSETHRAQAVAARGTAQAEGVAAVSARHTAEAGRQELLAVQQTAGARRTEQATAMETVQAQRAESEGLRGVSLVQRLANAAVNQYDLFEGERAALLARQAYLFDRRGGGISLSQVDEALRKVLGIPFFQAVLEGHQDYVTALAFSPDGATLASASNDGTVRLWDLRQPGAPPKVLYHSAGVNSLSFSQDGCTLASGSKDTLIHLWDLRTERVVPIGELEGHESSVTSVAFSSDSRYLASGSYDKTVRVWDLALTPAIAIHVLTHTSWVRSVAFSPVDRQYLIAGCGYPDSQDYPVDNGVWLWNLSKTDTGPAVLRDCRKAVASVAFSSDGKTIAAGSWDSTVVLWDTRKLDLGPTVLRGHDGQVRAVAFSADGRALASGSTDQTVLLWDPAQPAADPVLLARHRSWVTSVAFSRDRLTLASGSWYGPIGMSFADTETLANRVCDQVSRNLTVDEWHRFVGTDIPYERTCSELPPG